MSPFTDNSNLLCSNNKQHKGTGLLAQRNYSESIAGPKAEFAETMVLLAQRRVWLPSWLYEALPYLYMLGGGVALTTTIFVSNWTWMLPHFLLLGCFSVHIGAAILRLRHKQRVKALTSSDLSGSSRPVNS